MTNEEKTEMQEKIDAARTTMWESAKNAVKAARADKETPNQPKKKGETMTNEEKMIWASVFAASYAERTIPLETCVETAKEAIIQLRTLDKWLGKVGEGELDELTVDMLDEMVGGSTPTPTDPSKCPDCGRDLFSTVVDGRTVWDECKCKARCPDCGAFLEESHRAYCPSCYDEYLATGGSVIWKK